MQFTFPVGYASGGRHGRCIAPAPWRLSTLAPVDRFPNVKPLSHYVTRNRPTLSTRIVLKGVADAGGKAVTLVITAVAARTLVSDAFGVLALAMGTGWLLGVVCVVAGLGVGTVWTNTDALVSSLARSGRLGTTMGVAGSFKEIGDMLGPALIGALSQALGLTAGFVICGVMGIACAAAVRSGPEPSRATPEEPEPRRDG